MKTNKQSNNLSYVLLLGIIFLVVEYLYEFGLHPAGADYESMTEQSLILVVLFALVFWVQSFINQNFAHARKIINEFFSPLLIAFFVLITGTIGFLKLNFDLGDAIFASANLLTLNFSVFSSVLNEKTPNLLIMAARIFGGIFLAYAFFYAVVLAVGKEEYSRIRFRWYRTVIRKPFTVVIGNGLKAVFLAKDLCDDGIRVVLLHEGFNEAIQSMLDDINIWCVQGNASSETGLKKTYFHMAEKVFVLHESDEKNFRIVQEMDQLVKNGPELITSAWYVHLSDPRKRALMANYARVGASDSESVRKTSIHSFDILQNIARKLTFEHKIDRFENGAHVAQVVLIGFNALAEAIALQCLRIGHFKAPRHLQIKVYYTAEEQTRVNQFIQAHPELFRNDSVFNTSVHPAEAKLFRTVRKYTFFGQSDELIQFEPLPEAESKLISPDFSLYDCIKAQSCTSIYVCLPNGLESAALLNAILPCLAQKMEDIAEKTGDVQVFYHYNFPDEGEEVGMQERLKSVADKLVDVHCFGSYRSVCTKKEIDNHHRDLLAKHIAFLYSVIPYNKEDVHQEIEDTKKLLDKWHCQSEELETNWREIGEVHRESNRQAADQAWVKFREVGRSAENLSEDLRNYWGDDLAMLAEIEHRRWNAEKLLLGWLPTLKNTDENKAEKKKQDKQKRHFYLMDFDSLPDKQKLKDYTQVIGLPYFIRYAFIEIPPCDRYLN